ncbi:MAG: DICT sensory domain-containing protein, partial [Phormidesmis sp.]
MNSHAMSLLSLQARLNSLHPQPASVAVDPKGFKAALESFIQFLIEHEVSATLWLKLPKDDAWWEDIWQYGQQAVGCTIYVLGEQVGQAPNTMAASLRSIPIESTGALKKEYLCLAVAENFMGALLAARGTNAAPVSGKAAATNKRNLQLYCTTAARTMTALAAGIRSVLQNSLPELTIASAEPPTDERFIAAAAALSQWERCFPASVLSQNVLPLSEDFLTWQMQFQEDMRSQIQAARGNAAHDGQNGADGGATPQANGIRTSIAATFLSQASQELRSPLTTIKTALTLLGSPTLKLAQRQRYLEMISTQCEHQQDLIKSIIELLEVQTTAMAVAQSIQLSDLIPGIVSTYQPIAEEHGIMLAYTVPENLPEISGIESEIKQVVIHLINNGIQVTPEGGRVWVSAMVEDNKFVALKVQDSGDGIAKTDINRLFEPFYQLANSSSGTGLGLTL